MHHNKATTLFYRMTQVLTKDLIRFIEFNYSIDLPFDELFHVYFMKLNNTGDEFMLIGSFFFFQMENIFRFALKCKSD